MTARFRIAFAEDDPAQGDLMEHWLRACGFDVVPFGTGDALVGWAEGGEGTADAVVLDVDMPGRDGVECCRALRTLPGFAEIPIVCVTGRVTPAVAERAREAGALDLIAKDAALLPRVESWLDGALRGAEHR